jgi:F-type H+-transporting ATPase subunit delta
MASVASTYARAFADVVMSKHLDADRSIAELRTIASLLDESSDLRRVWENPAIPADQKRRVLDVIVKRDGISTQARNLVAVLIDHRRTHFLELTGKKVRAQYGQDASLLGGAVVRIGSTIYDGSVKGQLERIREEISGN